MSLANRTIDLASKQVLVAADGTAAAPAITNDGDTNTGLFFPAADTIAASTGGTEAMRIDSSGNVGIGRTPTAQKLEVGSGNIAIFAPSANFGGFLIYDSSGNLKGTFEYNGSSFIQFGTSTNLPLLFNTNNTERLRITSGGEVYIAGTTDQGAYNLQVNGTGCLS